MTASAPCLQGEVGAVAEVAEVLGVTPRRVQTLALRPDFPKPVSVLSRGRIWRLRDIREWVEATT